MNKNRLTLTIQDGNEILSEISCIKREDKCKHIHIVEVACERLFQEYLLSNFTKEEVEYYFKKRVKYKLQ